MQDNILASLSELQRALKGAEECVARIEDAAKGVAATLAKVESIAACLPGKCELLSVDFREYDLAEVELGLRM
jgi:hypothetical protein